MQNHGDRRCVDSREDSYSSRRLPPLQGVGRDRPTAVRHLPCFAGITGPPRPAGRTQGRGPLLRPVRPLQPQSPSALALGTAHGDAQLEPYAVTGIFWSAPRSAHCPRSRRPGGAADRLTTDRAEARAATTRRLSARCTWPAPDSTRECGRAAFLHASRGMPLEHRISDRAPHQRMRRRLKTTGRDGPQRTPIFCSTRS